jgi:hypothetical protein
MWLVPCTVFIQQDFCGGEDGEPMIRSFVTLVWGVREAVAASDERVRLLQTVFAHKAEETEYAGQTGLRWWSKTCKSDREASLMVAPDMVAKKNGHVYAYLGGGSISATATALMQSIVVNF